MKGDAGLIIVLMILVGIIFIGIQLDKDLQERERLKEVELCNYGCSAATGVDPDKNAYEYKDSIYKQYSNCIFECYKKYYHGAEE